MRKSLLFFILFFPAFVCGQSREGIYRAVFFNLFSESRMTVAEFNVKADNPLAGKIKIDETVKTFSGTIDKSGRFEAVIEQLGNFTYKLKGRFDKNNKISLVQRNKNGLGLNVNVSESAVEGKFSKIAATEKIDANQPLPPVELLNNGGNHLRITHSDGLFGTDWADFSAAVTFGNSAVTPLGTEAKRVTGTADASDYFVVRAKSKINGQQNLSISVPLSDPAKKIWRQNELRVTSYRETSGERRNTFISGGATLRNDPRFAEGTLEIVSETAARIVFKLTNFKIKRLSEEDAVTFGGYIYADK